MTEHDYSDYEVYSKYKKGMVLLRSSNEISDISDSDYFGDAQFKKNTENQSVFY